MWGQAVNNSLHVQYGGKENISAEYQHSQQMGPGSYRQEEIHQNHSYKPNRQ